MAHFTKLGIGNKVEKVEVVNDDIAINEQAGVDFLNNLYNTKDVWKQTFTDGTRKNFAGINYSYKENLDAFIPPQDFSSWTLNETTCQWEAPVDLPDDDKDYIWNEEIKNWKEKE